MSAETLTPKLTAFDKRVLRALEPWPGDWLERLRAGEPLPRRTAWAVAEALREDDVALVRRTLRGLTHLGYADSHGWDHRQAWLRNESGTEAMGGGR